VNINAKIYTDEDAARRYLEKRRWPSGPVCPHCAAANEATKLTGKSTRKGVYWCNACQKPFSVTVGTVFERSHVPLTKWLLAADLITESNNTIAIHELHRTLGVTYKTALSMANRIREASKDGHSDPLIGKGPQVETDEISEVELAKPVRSRKVAGKVRRTKAERRADAIKQILDVSEELFSIHGYPGVTIKDVADKIGVHSALILYYFDGKQALFDAVWDRRIHASVVSRAKSLDDYAAEAGDNPTVEGLLTAYYGSAFSDVIEGGEGLRNFGRLFALINNAPGYGAEKMQLTFDPVALRLIAILQKLLPGVPKEDIFWGFQFTSGAYSQCMARTGRIDRLSDGLCRSDDLEAVRERMSVFMAAGFESLRNRKPRPATKKGRK
jgi:AcrR family transcriptional regulator/transposase-like protein